MANIYAIKNKNTGAISALVRAVNKGAALRHVAESTFDAGKAKQDELIAALTAGLTVQDATPEVAEAAEAPAQGGAEEQAAA